MMWNLKWTPEQIDALEPVEFDKIHQALDTQKEIERKQQEEMFARLKNGK